MLDRDWVRMLDLGGNIFYIFKLALVDERSMQFFGGAFSGMTEEQFIAMMAAGADDIELITWLITRRGDEHSIRRLHRTYQVPASNTAAGLALFDNRS